MKNFIVRIELHDGTWPDDYVSLHKAMILKGFSHNITSKTGEVYTLPTAEYHIVKLATIESILKDSHEAAQMVGKKYMVLVSECSNIMWDFLPVV